MLRLRLQRRGKRNYATYRVVVADGHAPVKGKFIADVGHYNPHTDMFSINKEAVLDWLGKGVQPSPTVHNLLVSNKVIEAKKVTSWRPKKKGSDANDTNKHANDANSGEAGEKKEEKEQETQPSREASASEGGGTDQVSIGTSDESSVKGAEKK